MPLTCRRFLQVETSGKEAKVVESRAASRSQKSLSCFLEGTGQASIHGRLNCLVCLLDLLRRTHRDHISCQSFQVDDSLHIASLRAASPSLRGHDARWLRRTALARQQKAKSLFLTDANDITSEASTDLRAAKVQSIVFPDADRQTMDSEATSDGLPLQSSYKEGLYFPEGPPLSAASSHQDAASSATAAYQSHPEFGLALEPDDSNVSTAGHHGNLNAPSSDPPDAVIDAFEVWLSERGEIVPPDDEDDNYMDTAGGPPDRTRQAFQNGGTAKTMSTWLLIAMQSKQSELAVACRKSGSAIMAIILASMGFHLTKRVEVYQSGTMGMSTWQWMAHPR